MEVCGHTFKWEGLLTDDDDAGSSTWSLSLIFLFILHSLSLLLRDIYSTVKNYRITLFIWFFLNIFSVNDAFSFQIFRQHINSNIPFRISLNKIWKNNFEIIYLGGIREEKTTITEKKIEKKAKEEGDSIIFHSTVYMYVCVFMLYSFLSFSLIKHQLDNQANS
jgi:hypothetical protein